MMNQEKTAVPERRRSKWYSLVVVGLAVLLLYLAIRGGSWEEVLQTVRGTRPLDLALVFLLVTLSLVLRAARWGVLLSAEKWIHLPTLFWATSAGYVSNTFLPARAGELIRSVLLGGKTGLSAAYVLATALTERIMDVLALLMIGICTLPVLHEIPTWLPAAMRLMGVLAVVAVGLLLILPHQEAFFRTLLHKLPFLPAGWREKLDQFLGQALLGAKAFLSVPRMALFVGLTAGIWLLDGVTGVQVAHALQLRLTLSQVLLLLMALGFSSAVPSTPGYVGIYQFVAVTILPFFGLSRSQALTYILISQAVNVVTITVWGVPGLGFLNAGKSRQRSS